MSTDDLWQEADALPFLFEDKKALLDGLLKRAIGGLLSESRQRNILNAPYGRPEQPSPLVSLEQFLKNGGLAEPTDGSVNDEPTFSYEYGFDPLKYLANYLKFLHPKNIKQMRDVRDEACDFLRTRAAHAQIQMKCLYELQDLTRRLRSGILWGPLIAPSTSPSSVSGTLICACKAVKEGELIVEVATESSFAAVERSWRQRVDDGSQIQKLVLTNLEPAQTYFLRCYLLREGEDDIDSSIINSSSSSSQGAAKLTTTVTDASPTEETVEGDSTQITIAVEGSGQAVVGSRRHYQSCQFTVSPVDDEGASTTAVQVISVNARSAHAVSSSFDVDAAFSAGCCTVSCFLGELFPSPPKRRTRSRPSAATATATSTSTVAVEQEQEQPHISPDTEWYQQMTFLLHRYARAFSASDTVLRGTSMLLAWHDRSADSDARLGDEEAAVKRFLGDLGKYQKKHGKGARRSSAATAKNKRGGAGTDAAAPSAPRLQRPALGTAMEALLQALPLEIDGQFAAKNADHDDIGPAAVAAAVRQLYYTQMLGPKVQLLVLDHRRGYLGKEQVAWLTETLKSSPATWKLVLSGAPFGVGMSTVAAAVSASASASTSASASVNGSVAIDATVFEDEAAAETKDQAAGEGGHVAAASTNEEEHQQLDEAEDPSMHHSATMGVKMTLPPPIEAAGWDEAGRLKLSLQSVIAGLQKAAMKDKREKLRFQHEKAESKTAEAGSGSIPPDPVKALSQNNSGSAGRPDDDRLLMESGIVILSSGACVPEDRAKVLAKASALPLSAEVPPFVMVYDPCGAGTAFCMEICIGGGDGFSATDLSASAAAASAAAASAGFADFTGGDERSFGSQSPAVTASHTPRPSEDGSAATTIDIARKKQGASTLHPVVSTSLGARVVFGLQPAGADLPLALSCASVASLASDGSSLDVKIVAVSPDGTELSPLFACTLRCDNHFTPQPE